MLYTVECRYTDAKTEQAWNDFYSIEKLPALISVTGFLTSQRFKALTSNCPTYLAIHTVIDEHVIISDEYKQKGGGNFARWQSNITDWHRNLYDVQGTAPAVLTDEILLLSPRLLQFDQTIAHSQPIEMQAIGLDRSPHYRIAYILQRIQAENLASLADVDLYEPITIQLKNLSHTQRHDEV